MKENKSYEFLNLCRLCNGYDLKEFINFGNIPLGNNLQKDYKKAIKAEKYPLKIQRCKQCGHFQLSVSVNPKKLYSTNYTYLSSIGKNFVTHLEEYVQWAIKEFNLKNDSLVLDIGSNDGTCLSFFKKYGCKVLGIDPARLPSEIANRRKIQTINDFFNDKNALYIEENYGKIDLITSHNVLAHVEDLSSTFSNIFNLLKEEGFFVFEIGYFKNVLENNYFDTTYHEHLDYHHAIPLFNKLKNVGFKVIQFSNNKVQGGSLRVVCKKSEKITNNNIKVTQFINAEYKSILYETSYLENWISNIKKKMNIFGEKIRSFKKNGKIICGYGAPTKATLLISIAQIGNQYIDFIVEDNDLKVNLFMPSNGIPIFEFNKVFESKPDIFVIFAWNFSDNIISKLKKHIYWHSKCIIPLPEYKEVLL